MKKTDVSKLTRTTRAPSEDSHFENINDAIEFGNGHINIFNQIRALAQKCKNQVLRPIYGDSNELATDDASIAKRREKVDITNPGNAYAMVVKFLSEYSKKIEEYKKLPFKTEAEKAKKEAAAKELEVMLFAFQGQINEKADEIKLTRASHSKDLYNNLKTVMGEMLDNANVTAFKTKIANSVGHVLSPTTWIENLKKWGNEKLTFAQLPDIPPGKSVVPLQSTFVRLAEGADAVGKKILSIILRPKAAPAPQSNNNDNNNNNAIERTSPREALSVAIVNILGKNTDVLARLAELEKQQLLSGRDDTVEKEADFMIQGGNQDPLFKDLKAYNAKDKNEVSPTSKKGQERQRKKEIAIVINATLQMMFPEFDVHKMYKEAIEELTEALKAIEEIEKDNAKLLSGSDLKGMLNDLKELCNSRLVEYKAAKETKDKLDLKFAKPKIEDVVRNNVGAFTSDIQRKFDKDNLGEKDKFILAHVAIANIIEENLSNENKKSIAEPYSAYYKAITELMDKDRSDEHDQEWQLAAKVVDDAYIFIRHVVEEYNKPAKGDREMMIPMHDVLPRPAAVASMVAGQRVHNPIEFMNQHNLVMTNMFRIMGKAESGVKELAGYKEIQKALERYSVAMQKLMYKYEDRNAAISVFKAYEDLRSAIKQATELKTTVFGQVQYPPVELVQFVNEHLNNALLVDKKPPVDVPAQQVEMRRESVKTSSPAPSSVASPPASSVASPPASSVASPPTSSIASPSTIWATSNLGEPAERRESVKEKFSEQLRKESIEVDNSPKGLFIRQHEQLVKAIQKGDGLTEVFAKHLTKTEGYVLSYEDEAYSDLRKGMIAYEEKLIELKAMKREGTDADAAAWNAKAIEVQDVFLAFKKLADDQSHLKMPEPISDSKKYESRGVLSDAGIQYNREFMKISSQKDFAKRFLNAINTVKHDIELPAIAAQPIEPIKPAEQVVQAAPVMEVEKPKEEIKVVVKDASTIFEDDKRAFNVGMTNIRRGIGSVIHDYLPLKDDVTYQKINTLYTNLIKAVNSPDHDHDKPATREKAARDVVKLYGELKNVVQQNAKQSGSGAQEPINAMCNVINQWMENHPLVVPTMQAAQAKAAAQQDTGAKNTSIFKLK
jgi:hypothetical protein